VILTAHQPVYMPWLGLFHKIALADRFVFFDQVQYVPKDYISRNLVKTAQCPIWLTVPVLTKGYLTKTIAQIEINNGVDWRRKHWKTIYLNYKSARYFKDYSDFFESVYIREWKYLADLNFYMLNWFLKTLGINVVVNRAGECNFNGVKSDLVLDMCIQLGADMYIFGALGKDYAEVEKFIQANIIPVFQDYKHPSYHQLHGDFVPNLSVMDLLFNEGRNALEIIMSSSIGRNELLVMCQGKVNK